MRKLLEALHQGAVQRLCLSHRLRVHCISVRVPARQSGECAAALIAATTRLSRTQADECAALWQEQHAALPRSSLHVTAAPFTQCYAARAMAS